MIGPTVDPTVEADVAGLLSALDWPAHTPLRPVRGGADHHLWQTRSGNHTLLVKTGPHDGARFASAAWASRTLRAAGVPAAVVVGHTSAVLLEQCCPGLPIAADGIVHTADLRTAAAAGRLLRRVHRIPVAGFGRLDGAGTGRLPTLAAWLLDPIRQAANVDHHAADAKLIGDAHRALTRHRRLLPDIRTARLVHGDWAARHVITNQSGTITGLVDLASIRGGHPLSDLAAWSLQEPATLTAALFDGYFTGPPSGRPAALLTLLRVRIGAALLTFHRSRPGDETLAEKYRNQLARDMTALETGNAHATPQAPAPAGTHPVDEPQ
jgi:hypothetical protein